MTIEVIIIITKKFWIEYLKIQKYLLIFKLLFILYLNH